MPMPVHGDAGADQGDSPGFSARVLGRGAEARPGCRANRRVWTQHSIIP
jgi:hypothetical protein